MKTKRRIWLGLLITIFAACMSKAEQRCEETQHPEGGFWMVAREARAYFYSRPQNETAAAARLKRFVVLGDLVSAIRPDGRAPEDPLMCAVYYGAGGSRSYGWIRETDFVPLPLTQDSPEPSPELRDVLFRLPATTAWPTSGVTPYPCHDAEDFVGDFVCVRRADFEKKELCVSTTHRPFDPEGECGKLEPRNRSASLDSDGLYNVYLFHNAIAVISQQGAWGNHGQSNPAGVYVFSGAADRACRTGRIAPATPYGAR
jgi:hypothetical protein